MRTSTRQQAYEAAGGRWQAGLTRAPNERHAPEEVQQGGAAQVDAQHWVQPSTEPQPLQQPARLLAKQGQEVCAWVGMEAWVKAGSA